jgi:alpha-tubulin suppressor-like RCC1 family protein
VYQVATLLDLPDAAENAGRFIYVASVGSYRYSNGYAWLNQFGSVPGFAPVFTLWTWGGNNGGQLGDNTTTPRSSPGTTAGAGTTWCQVSAGYHTAAVKTDGTLWTWGYNRCGPLGDGTTTNRSSPVTTAGAGTTWCQVSAGGYYHTTAVKTDGTLWTWGRNNFGELGDGTTTNRSSPVTTAGAGTTWCQASAGGYHTVAVKTDGTLWTWGYNGSGRLGDNTTTDQSSPVTTAGGGTTWCQASAGYRHIAAVKTDGTLWTWGYNGYGRLGDNTTTDQSSPVTTAGGGTTWCQASAGYRHTTAIKTDGTLWTWGRNNCGQLGDNTTTNRSSPVTTAGAGTTWCQVSAGGYYNTTAVKTDGTLWTWGRNNTGQLGTGTTTDQSSPGTTAGAGTTWCQVSAGGGHTAAIQVIPCGFFSNS